MLVRRLIIKNFRGVSDGVIDFKGHTLLVGGNNVGKSTVCEALDLVLGPERLFRRPVVDEHDFHCGLYLDGDGKAIEMRIEAILTGLSEEVERRFYRHLRRWNDLTGTFVDEDGGGIAAADVEYTCWALPVEFLARYDKVEDDFVGNTFFCHPLVEGNADEEEGASLEPELGLGMTAFTKREKRLCGFIYLRTLRTGSRALSLQRGSLLDTILRLAGDGSAEMWQSTLQTLHGLEPAIGDIDKLKSIRSEIHQRMGRFVTLASGDKSTAFFASDLTREHLREVVHLFIATEPCEHLVPFGHLGTGSLNLLVFALLTFIAELKESHSVIFAMEEPEIALPPHTQRRVTKFILSEMGQSIVTSHSPYVIEQFEPDQVVMIDRNASGALKGVPIDVKSVKPKTYRTQRRQFAEAILGRAVLVVEGSTESAIFPVASSVLEDSLGSGKYTHLDLAGVTIFTASGDGDVPRHGPIFKALGKLAFGFYDKQIDALTADAQMNLSAYTQVWESPEKGIENLLLKELHLDVIKRFLADVETRPDYPSHAGSYDPSAPEQSVRELARNVLKARKGEAYGYGGLLIAQCQSADELPATLRLVLDSIHRELSSTPEDTTADRQGRLA